MTRGHKLMYTGTHLIHYAIHTVRGNHTHTHISLQVVNRYPNR